MIKQTSPLDEIDMVPHAIFARPLCYFTVTPISATDDLDAFEGAAFALDNDVHFCLRHYLGHRDQTVTFYLEYGIERVEDIKAVLQRTLIAFELSKDAVLWRRGEDFLPGELRVSTERLSEKEARILTLKIAATQPDHRATTTFIKNQVPRYFPLTEVDMTPYPSRGREPRWRQIVGNVTSHSPSSSSIYSRGLALKTSNGVEVTADGINYLNSIGFSVPRDL
jgi:hypothetical protein